MAHKPLSPREVEVMNLACQGLTAPQIAAKLGTSPATVRTQRERLMTKLGASTMAQAVFLWMERGA
jgi:DNA-binding NarL/FixJ family response regulator